jgi:hypothetical protein
MRTHTKVTLAGLAAAGAIISASPSFAGCADTLAPADPSGNASWMLQPADFTNSPIVGLWSVSLVSGNSQVDWGYSEWHSDGTEIMNSGGHSPASGNFCLGVWKQTGANSFHLKHFPLAYNPATGALAARILLTEDVTVFNGGQSFKGTFTQDVYDPSGKTLVLHMLGTITGQRVLPN